MAVAADIEALVAKRLVAVALVTVATPSTVPIAFRLVIVDEATVVVENVDVPPVATIDAPEPKAIEPVIVALVTVAFVATRFVVLVVVALLVLA